MADGRRTKEETSFFWFIPPKIQLLQHQSMNSSETRQTETVTSLKSSSIPEDLQLNEFDFLSPFGEILLKLKAQSKSDSDLDLSQSATRRSTLARTLEANILGILEGKRIHLNSLLGLELSLTQQNNIQVSQDLLLEKKR